jgi:hypothetical protein
MAAKKNSDRILTMRGFVFFWGLASCFGFFPSYFLRTSPISILIAVLGAGVMINPGSLPLLTLLLVARVSKFLMLLPFGWNHEIWAFVIDLMLLMSIARNLAKGVKFTDLDTIGEYFLPVARVSVILVYFFAAFQKLNSDFLLNLEISCGGAGLRRLLSQYSIPLPAGHWAEMAASWMTVGAELGIPLFLAFPRLRPYGLLLISIFHFAIGISRNTDFSTYAFAIGALFMTGAHWRFAMEYVISLARERVKVFKFFSNIWFRVAGTMALIFLLSEMARPMPVRIRWMPLGLMYIGIQILGLLDRRRSYAASESDLGIGSKAYLVPLLLLPLCVLSPYLGFRTEGSFSMFSNLRTEGGVNNHLFMPNLHLFDYQDDLVEIVDFTGPTFIGQKTESIIGNVKLVFYEFQKAVKRHSLSHPDYKITYKIGQQVIGPITLSELAARLPQYSYLEKKLLWFRMVQKGKNFCTH